MKNIFLLVMFVLSSALFGQVPTGNNDVWLDDVNVANGSAFQDLENWTKSKSRYKNVAALTAATADSNNVVVILGEIASAYGGGQYVQVDSTYPEGYSGVAYDNATPGKQWILQDFVRSRTLNPLDFGVVPNDWADDAATFQNCLDFAGKWVEGSDSGLTVIVPPGVYHFASTVTVPYKVNVISQMAIDYIASSATGTGRYGATVFMGLVALTEPIMQNQKNGPTWTTYWYQNSTVRGILFDGTNMTSLTANHGLLNFENAIGVVIENCGFYQSPQDGIALAHCLSYSIIKCPIIDNDQSGINQLSVSTDGKIEGCQIGLNGNFGIEFGGGTALVRCFGNKVFNNQKGGIDIAGATSVRNIVGNNDIHDNDGYGIKITSAFNLVTGNQISKNDSIGIQFGGAEHITISSNVISADTDQRFGAIFLANTDSITFTNNTFAGVSTGKKVTYADGKGYAIANNSGWHTSGYGDLYNDFNITSSDTFDLTVGAYQVLHFLSAKSRRNGNVTIQGDSALKVLQTGVYELSFTASFKVPDTTGYFQIYPFRNGALGTEMQKFATEFSGGWLNQRQAVSFSGIANLTANDVVHLQIRNATANTDVYLEHANFYIKQLRIGQE